MTGRAWQKCGGYVFAGWTGWLLLLASGGQSLGNDAAGNPGSRDHGITRKVTEAVTGGLKGA